MPCSVPAPAAASAAQSPHVVIRMLPLLFHNALLALLARSLWSPVLPTPPVSETSPLPLRFMPPRWLCLPPGYRVSAFSAIPLLPVLCPFCSSCCFSVRKLST